MFYEAYNKQRFEDAVGHKVHFVQDNHSVSHEGVLRGLHFQKGNKAQAKLLSVSSGEVLDVVVDIRKVSPTFGHYLKIKTLRTYRSIAIYPTWNGTWISGLKR